jgi:hypothetical protein
MYEVGTGRARMMTNPSWPLKVTEHRLLFHHLQVDAVMYHQQSRRDEKLRDSQDDIWSRSDRLQGHFIDLIRLHCLSIVFNIKKVSAGRFWLLTWCPCHPLEQWLMAHDLFEISCNVMMMARYCVTCAGIIRHRQPYDTDAK